MRLSFAFLFVLSGSAFADSSKKFEEILDEHWTRAKQERVFFRTDPDTFRMNGKLPEFSSEARQRRKSFNKTIIKKLAKINGRELSKSENISFRLFKYEREAEAKSYQQLSYLFPITKLFGYHTYFANAPANMSFSEEKDYANYLISLADFPRYNAEHISLLNEAIDKGLVHHCESMLGYDKTISQHIAADVKDSNFYAPFRSFPDQISTVRQKELLKKGSRIIAKQVIPEYKKLLDFYTNNYIKACRQTASISSVKGGTDYYLSEVEFHTTTKMNPKAIHQLGLSEVKRIRQEMLTIIDQVKFKGDFKDFLAYLREEPKFYAKTELELLGRAALISKNMEGELPKFFSFLPRGTFKIKPGNRGAFYMASSGDGKTSGTYFLGTQDLKSQPFYTLEALTFHEGVPGHHLQAAIALEVDMPEFRKTLYHSAYGEGWGLYSERLGKEMGFYEDPYSDFGRLTYEMFRAVRLVVDTGIHAFGWSRTKAITYMLDNTALSQKAVENQINRYITWPAQALSYKIGELKIRELRANAELKLGDKFDLRSFHDTIVGSGSLPMPVLEALIEDWIANKL